MSCDEEDAIQSTVPKLVEKLSSPSVRTREAALVALAALPVKRVIEPVANLLLEETSPEVRVTCLDLLERLGASASLSDVRVDGWFDQLASRINHFDQICDTMGARLLAYAITLGVQIRSITTDPRVRANTTIEFTIGDDRIQTLPLVEFRIRVVQAILQMQRTPITPTLPLTPEQGAAIIGGKYLLLAPLFEISLEQVVLATLDEVPTRAIVGYLSKDGFNFVTLSKFDELIKGKVRKDLATMGEEPFKIDLSAVDRARLAFEVEDYEKIIAALESWPGLLSILLQTPVIHELDDAQRAKLGEGLDLLGIAFEKKNRDEWSEELFKLGIQFARESHIAGRLFEHLGALLSKKERFSEAIGILRRAMALGQSEATLLAPLGWAYLKTGKLIPAAALLERAAASGICSQHVETGLSEIRDQLARAGLSWTVPQLQMTPKGN
ncbi:MAG: hypothetical protein QNJ97_03735 [Myxococcota bacterium]|nr:hypothetical protein [Myxococcota bacterium]